MVKGPLDPASTEMVAGGMEDQDPPDDSRALTQCPVSISSVNYSTTLQVSKTPLGAQIEIEYVAFVVA